MQAPDIASLPAAARQYDPVITGCIRPEILLTIDGERYAAHTEDGLLIVHGRQEGGRTLPAPRPESYVVRVDAIAELKGLALFG